MQLLLFAIGALGDEFQVIVVERHGEAAVRRERPASPEEMAWGCERGVGDRAHGRAHT